MGRRRLVGGALVALLCVSTAMTVAPAASATTVGSVTTSTPAGTLTQDAASATRETIRLRQQTRALITQYLTDYGDRFTPEERATLVGLRAEADRSLATLVVSMRRLNAAIDDPGSSPSARSAARTALAAHGRARLKAEAAYEQARTIVEPKLSIFELLGAARDYDRMLGAFDALGERIRAISARTR